MSKELRYCPFCGVEMYHDGEYNYHCDTCMIIFTWIELRWYWVEGDDALTVSGNKQWGRLVDE